MALRTRKETRSVVQKILSLPRLLLISFYLGIVLLGCNLFQYASIVVRPFSKKTFRRINHFIAHVFWKALCDSLKKFNHYSINYSGDHYPEKEKKNILIIVNHQAICDIPLILDFAHRKGCKGTIKFFLKESLKYIPGVGWGGRLLEFLFVKRNWTRDKKFVQQVLHCYREYDVPYSIVIFPESTRITAKKLQRSQQRAKEKGIGIETKQVLSPREKGFVTTLQSLRDNLDIVYDVTISYPEGAPTLLQLLSGNGGPINVDAKGYNVATLPLSEEALTTWLQQRFQEKDSALANFAAI